MSGVMATGPLRYDLVIAEEVNNEYVFGGGLGGGIEAIAAARRRNRFRYKKLGTIENAIFYRELLSSDVCESDKIKKMGDG